MRGHRARRATLQWAKFGPPRSGCSAQARGSVATFVRATSPTITPLLATGLRRAITEVQSKDIWLHGYGARDEPPVTPDEDVTSDTELHPARLSSPITAITRP